MVQCIGISNTVNYCVLHLICVSIRILRTTFSHFGLLVNKKNGGSLLLLGRTRGIIHSARASVSHATFHPLILFRGGAEQELMATVTLSISPLSQFLNNTLEGSDVAPMSKDKTFHRTWCLASQVYQTPTMSTCDSSPLRFILYILG